MGFISLSFLRPDYIVIILIFFCLYPDLVACCYVYLEITKSNVTARSNRF